MKLAHRKVITILLAVFMVISLAACGGGASNQGKDAEKPAASDSAKGSDNS